MIAELRTAALLYTCTQYWCNSNEKKTVTKCQQMHIEKIYNEQSNSNCHTTLFLFYLHRLLLFVRVHHWKCLQQLAVVAVLMWYICKELFTQHRNAAQIIFRIKWASLIRCNTVQTAKIEHYLHTWCFQLRQSPENKAVAASAWII